MGESAIGVQAAAGAPPAAAPLQLKLFTVPAVDPNTGAAVLVAVQAMCLVDDQGRAYQALTEVTGRKLLAVLDRLAQIESQERGQLYTSALAGVDAPDANGA